MMSSSAIVRSIRTGSKYAGAAMGLLITIFTVDSFVSDYSIPVGGKELLFGFILVPLFAFVGGAYSRVLRDCVEKDALIDSLEGKLPKTLTDLFHSNPKIIEKIEAVRWKQLVSAEREFLYQRYLSLDPQPHAGNMVAATVSRQMRLQKKRPINLDLLRDLLVEFGVGDFHFSIPMDVPSYKVFRQSHSDILERVVHNASTPLGEKQASTFREAYGLLSCAELAPSDEVVRGLDIIIVPGARWSLQQRVDFAVLKHKISGAHLVFTGGYPRYVETNVPPIAEAEAMMHYLSKKTHVGVLTDRIHIEKRARTSIEGLLHSLRYLHRLALVRSRPLNVGLVTSSYHMRRFYLQALEVYGECSTVVKGVICLVVPATLDIDGLLDGRGVDPMQRQALLRTFFSEYLKLIGGRVVGEF